MLDITKVGIACDHAGYTLKQKVKALLESWGLEYEDFGAFDDVSSDYADFAHPLADAIESGSCSIGIGICGSGEGMAMTLNKHQQVRAALCWRPEIAEITRKHNNSNVLVMPARFIDDEVALEMVRIFFDTEFEGGRHLRRIGKMPVK